MSVFPGVKALDEGEHRTVPSSPKRRPIPSMRNPPKMHSPAKAIAALATGRNTSTTKHTRNKVVSMVSASYGGRARRTEMPPCPQGMSCVMYTDTPVKAANGWMVDLNPYHTNMQKSHPELFTSGRHSIGRISSQMVKNNMAAKFYKMNMFLLPQLANADIIFWCDADSIKLACEAPQLADQIQNSLNGHVLTVKAHEQRNSVRGEMALAAVQAKVRGYPDGKRDIDDAWAHMEKMGFKDDAGLFHCNQFIFDARSPAVQNMLHAWWHEVQDYTFRDQISFPFVLQHFKPQVRVVSVKEHSKARFLTWTR